MSRSTSPSRTRAALLAGSAAALLALGLGAGATAAAAAPATLAAPQNGPTGASVSAVGPLGERIASPDGETTLTLAGSGFQSIQGGFGGLYVLFGWVADGAWQPSAGGGFGVTYAYQPDTQAAENSGFQKFVTFPGSTTASEANGSELALDGTWATDLVIPGPVLTVTDAAGENPRDIDCRVETCGIITFGAHGVVNANNETFTPISFEVPATEEAPPVTEEPAATPEPTERASESETGTSAATEASDSASATEETSVADAEASDEGGSSSAAPWVVAGSAAAAAIGATTAAIVATRRKRAAEAGDAGATPDSSED